MEQPLDIQKLTGSFSRTPFAREQQPFRLLYTTDDIQSSSSSAIKLCNITLPAPRIGLRAHARIGDTGAGNQQLPRGGNHR